jgi:hypothetical protein
MKKILKGNFIKLNKNYKMFKTRKRNKKCSNTTTLNRSFVPYSSIELKDFAF